MSSNCNSNQFTTKEQCSNGGKNRAAKLSPERRKEIAAKGGLSKKSKDGLLRATHAGTIKIGAIELPCSVLEDGRRVISMKGVTQAFGATQRGHKKNAPEEVRKLPTILATSSLKSFISKDLMESASHPIEFKPKTGGAKASGYECSLLPKICELIIDAHRAGSSIKDEYAKIAEVMLRGFAQVGITALVDEASGYQEIRDRYALQQILERYLTKEKAEWAKRFPDEFYKNIFRLRGWEYNPKNRPGCIGKYTNDIVYERISKNLLEELEKANPKTEDGYRLARHHQWLSTDVGHPALSKHIHAVIALMRASKNWEQFYEMIESSFPKRNYIEIET